MQGQLLSSNDAEKPYHDYGTNNGRANSADSAAPRDIQFFEKPAAYSSTDKTKHDVPQTAIAFAFHYPSGNGAGDKSYDNSFNHD